MAMASFHDHGVRFQYPSAWELEESEDGSRTMLSVQSPDGLSFVLITLDSDRPAVSEMVDEAVLAMREEYPDLDSVPAVEELGGYRAVGEDLEFSSLDLLNGCAVRGFRTPNRTILIFGQWAAVDLDDDEPEQLVRIVRMSLVETDG